MSAAAPAGAALGGSSSSSSSSSSASASPEDNEMVNPFPKHVPKLTERVVQKFKGHYTAWTNKYLQYINETLEDPVRITEKRAGLMMINTWAMCV